VCPGYTLQTSHTTQQNGALGFDWEGTYAVQGKDDSEVKMYYTIPVLAHNLAEETVGVNTFHISGLKERGISGPI